MSWAGTGAFRVVARKVTACPIVHKQRFVERLDVVCQKRAAAILRRNRLLLIFFGSVVSVNFVDCFSSTGHSTTRQTTRSAIGVPSSCAPMAAPE